LAAVFLEKAVQGFIVSGSIIGVITVFKSKMVIGFWIFGALTFGVLMCMDVMECFLHALRLHWYLLYFL
jgi:V-type H+-transporting ATPase subunit a